MNDSNIKINTSNANKVLSTRRYSWNLRLAEIWQDCLNHTGYRNNSIIIEIAPGPAPKIGLALKNLGFKGSLFVIEPDSSALKVVLKEYERMLPKAKIIALQKKLKDALPSLPQNVDAVLANHCIDDMILACCLTDEDSKAVFGDPYSEKMGMQTVQEKWQKLSARRDLLEDAKRQAYHDLEELLNIVQPKIVGIAQYPSYAFSKIGLTAPDASALEIMRRLKHKFGNTEARVSQRIAFNNMDPDNWWIKDLNRGTKPTDPREMVAVLPGAVERMGEGLFIKAPIYLERRTDVLFYSSYMRADQVNDVGNIAQCTLDQSRAIDPDPIGNIYVDMQKDPLNIALSGNLGSGRAYYVGGAYNVKGEKTPLAVSTREGFNDGILNLGNALWEAMFATCVHTNFKTGAFLPVGVIDSGHSVYDEYTKTFMPAAKLVRYDENGALDRPTHIHQLEAPRSREELLFSARQFGKQEAEKYIERVVHGAWSNGNIALDGRMIDFCTTSGVQTRHPQSSFTGWFETNYFGWEDRGQLRVLESFVDNPHINIDAVSRTEVEMAMSESMQSHFYDRFIDLMGFNSVFKVPILEKNHERLIAVVSAFRVLSSKVLPKLKSLTVWDKQKTQLALFDFSNFFRFFPLIVENEGFDDGKLLGLIINVDNPDFTFEDNENISPEVKSKLKSHLVNNWEEYQNVLKEIKLFIRDYYELYNSIKQDEFAGYESNKVKARAYVVNEDRYYLDYSTGNRTVSALAVKYSNGGMSKDHLNRMLNLIIQANNRIPFLEDGMYRVDMRLFLNGYTSKRLLRDGTFKYELRLFRDSIDIDLQQGAFKIRIDNKEYRCDGLLEGGDIVVSSPCFDFGVLLDKYDIDFYCNEEQIKLEDVFQ